MQKKSIIADEPHSRFERVRGFSKLSREEKLDLVEGMLADGARARKQFESFRHNDPRTQELLEHFSENTISNFHLPYGIVPGFIVNGKTCTVPLVTEESSVVAAISRSARFWSAHGGFTTAVKETLKSGQLHFTWKGDSAKLSGAFPLIREKLIAGTGHITGSMEKRGGGIKDIRLLDKTGLMDNYFQICAWFDTRDSMGANFINTCLEEFGNILRMALLEDSRFSESEKEVDILMAILSNYTGRCIATAAISCPVDELQEVSGGNDPHEFGERFCRAVKIAELDVDRAVTHNKGIFNGVDALLIATGNDFRAVEAAGHAWAARTGRYGGLTSASIDNGVFTMEISLPVPVGITGGVTSLHPLARRSFELLGNPDAVDLMGIVASVGLAANFAAVRALVTDGIQSGHMKMHLSNLLDHFNADDNERKAAAGYFSGKKAGFSAVAGFIRKIRNGV